jgi:HPt (histidine-containing phosphotransfer) domain-containing protein
MNFDQMMAELRVEYVASLPDKIKALEQHFAALDLEKIRDDFHKLKGTGKTYGIPEISELGEVCEKLCLKPTVKPDAFVGDALKLLREIHAARLSNQAMDVRSRAEFQKLTKLQEAAKP